jgi:hypothetical protein
LRGGASGAPAPTGPSVPEDALTEQNMLIYSNFNSKAPSIGECQLLHGKIVVNPGDFHQSRLANFLYSGDIINLSCCNGSIPTFYGNDVSNILMLPLSQIGKNNTLTKLRFVYDNLDPQNRLLAPLTYQRDVFIEFNSRDNQVPNRIANSKTLHVKKGNEEGDVFQIYNTSNPNDTGPLSRGDRILIARSLEDGNNNGQIYLAVGQQSIQTDATADNATVFTIDSAIGCGPNWLYDQDTRGLAGEELSESEIQDLAVEASDKLTEKIDSQTQSISNDTSTSNANYQTKLTQEQNVNNTLRQQLNQLLITNPPQPPLEPTSTQPQYLVNGQWVGATIDANGNIILNNGYALNANGKVRDSTGSVVENNVNLCPQGMFGPQCASKKTQ